MITHVAIRYNGRMYSLPKPARHFNVIHQIHIETGDMDIYGEQGFLDDQGNFLDRTQALVHATECKQLRPDVPLDNEWLYSENVW